MHDMLTFGGPGSLSENFVINSLLIRGPVDPRDWIPRVRYESSTRSGFGMMKMVGKMFGDPKAMRDLDILEALRTGKEKVDVPPEIQQLHDMLFADVDKRRKGGAGGASKA